MKALIYTRVSTREQGVSGLGLDAQKAKCAAEIESRGWMLVREVVEVASASGRQRPERRRHHVR